MLYHAAIFLSIVTLYQFAQTMSSLSQLLRFTLPPSTTRLTAFQALRERVSSKASVKSQYFGYMLPNEGFPDRTAENDMYWLISEYSLLLDKRLRKAGQHLLHL